MEKARLPTYTIIACHPTNIRQDSDVEAVTLYSGEDVELVIETSVVEHVENLHLL
jgi:hypothetical protein